MKYIYYKEVELESTFPPPPDDREVIGYAWPNHGRQFKQEKKEVEFVLAYQEMLN